ncbi:uncharacterized protein [Triticum aestivum]|uniref:uncharacterized protein n=1 Tax=Triticum aestivum TaxID=4565 RepID=UPI001D00AEB8|nr:uncharacterized protein LOC123101945 [Triticum aestivum]
MPPAAMAPPQAPSAGDPLYMEESTQPKPADPELPNGAGDPDQPEPERASPVAAPAAEEEVAAVEEVPSRSEPSKGAGTNADGWRPYTTGELLGEAAEAAAGRSDFADGNGAGSATPERSRTKGRTMRRRWQMMSIKGIFDRYQQATGTSLWIEQYERTCFDADTSIVIAFEDDEDTAGAVGLDGGFHRYHIVVTY